MSDAIVLRQPASSLDTIRILLADQAQRLADAGLIELDHVRPGGQRVWKSVGDLPDDALREHLADRQ